MKNIYITDLDHTFLRSDLSISDYTKKMWNSYAKTSILSVATARTYKKTMQSLEGIHVNEVGGCQTMKMKWQNISQR